MYVSVIEPGNYGTDIGKNMLARMDTSTLTGSRFEPQIRGAMRILGAFETNPPPDDVAEYTRDQLVKLLDEAIARGKTAR